MNLRSLSLALSLLLIASAAFAQSYTWTGTSGDWATGANWVGGTIPISSPSTNLTFQGSASFSSTNNIADPFLLHSFTLGSNPSAMNFYGGQLNFGNSGTIAVNTGWGNNISNDIVGTNLTITGTGTGQVGFRGNFTTSGLTLNNPGSAAFLGTTSFQGNTTIATPADTNTYLMAQATNSGIMRVNSGTIYVTPGVDLAVFTLASNSSLILSGGGLRVLGGELHMQDNSSILSSGTTGVISDGLFAVDGNATFRTNFVLASGTLGGLASSIIYSGSNFSWQGGVIAGSAGSGIAIQSVSISGSDAKTIDTRSVSLSGTWSGGNIGLLNQATLQIGNLTAVSDNVLSGTDGSLVIVNSLVKTSGTGTTTLSAPLTLGASGTLGASSGRILLTGGGTSTGFFRVLNSGTMEFGGGTYDLFGTQVLGNFTGSQSGGFVVSSGRVNFNINTGDTVGQNTGLTLLEGGTLGGSVSSYTISGTKFTWQGGVITGDLGSTVTIGTAALLSGTATKVLDTRSITLSGTWAGGNVNLLNHANFQIGSLTALSDNVLSGTDGQIVILNSFTKGAGTGTTTLNGALLNTGTLTASSGRLLLTGGGTSTGMIQTQQGGAIEFGGGTYDLSQPFGSFTGTQGGSFVVSGGRVNLNVSNGATVNQNTSLFLTGGTLGNTNNASFVISGSSFQWQGGVLTGGASTTISVNPVALISGTAAKTLDTASLNLSGTWSGGNLSLLNGGNLNLGSLTALSDNAITSDGSGRLTIFGSLTKSAGSGTTTLAAPITLLNGGTMTASSGRILLTGGGTSVGLIQASQGGAIEFGGGTYDLSNSSGSLLGVNTGTGGNYVVSGGRVNLNFNTTGTVNQNSSLTLLTGGTLGGTGFGYTLAGSSFQWQGGVFTGSATSSTTVSASTLISGTATKTVDTRNVFLASGTWSGGDITLLNGGFLGAASLAILSDNTVSSSGTSGGFGVSGIVRKSSGTGTTTIAAPLTIQNSSTLSASTGRILLTGGGTSTGTIESQAGSTVEFGGGTYDINSQFSSNILGTFSGSAGGKFVVSGGRLNLNVSGTVMQNASLTLVAGGTLGGSATAPVIGGSLFQWQGGVITGPSLGIGTPTVLSGTAIKVVDTPNLVIGSGTWTGGDIAITDGSQVLFTNTLIVQSDRTVTGSNGTLYASQFLKNTTTGTTTIGSALNVGAVTVQTGRLVLAGGGTSAGTFNVAAGSTVEFAGGTFGLGSSNPFFFTGTSTANYLVSGGQLAFNANSSGAWQGIHLTLVNGGTLGGSGSYVLTSNEFTWSGGVLGGASTGTTSLSMNLSGTNTWRIDSRTVAVTGTWTGGDVVLTNGGDFDARDLTWQTNNTVSGDGCFSVSGNLLKNTSGTNTVSAAFGVNTSGTALIQNGRLILTGGGGGDGSIVTGTAGTVEFRSGTYNFTGNALLGTGPGAGGNFLISGGQVNYNTNNGALGQNSNLTLVEGGTLGGTEGFYYVASDRFLWQGGVINGAPILNHALITGTATKVSSGGSVVMSGTWNGGDLTTVETGMFGANNLVIQSDNTLASGTNFNVFGTLVKNSSTGTTTIAAPLFLFAGGTLAADSGRILLTGGGTMQGAVYTGTAGTIEFGGGAYLLDSGGSLQGRAGGGGNYLISSGLLSLASFTGTENQNSTLTLLESGTLANLNYNTVFGTFRWQGGVVTGSNYNWAMNSAVLSGTAVKTVRAVTLNIFSGTWSGGDLSLENSSLGLSDFTVLGDHTLTTDSSLPVTLSNVSKISGTGTMAIMAPVLVSSGTVASSSGAILLAGGGTISGLLNTQSGGNIDLTGGVFEVNSGSFGQNGNFGSTDGTGGTFRISQGSVNLNYSATFNNQGNLALLEGGTLGGRASSYVLAGKSFNWLGGAITGTAGSTASIFAPTLISGTAAKTLDGRSVGFSGTWNGGDILLINSATLSAGSLTIAGDNIISGSGVLGIFSATKTAATGTTTIAAPLLLTGTLTADSGRILLTGGGTNSANSLFQTHAGGAIEFGGGTFNLANNQAFGSFSGSTGGDFFITGGRVNINAFGVTINQGTNLTLATGGTLGGTSSYTMAGNSFQWTGGVITGPAGSSLSVNVPAVLSGSGTKTVDTRSVSLNTGTWTGGDIAINNGSLSLGDFLIQSDNTLSASGTGSVSLFNVTKNTTTGTTIIAAPLALTGTLTSDSGRILLTGGGTTGANSLFQTHAGGAIEFGGGIFNLANNQAFGSFSGSTGGDFFITGGRVNINAASVIGQGVNLTLATGGTLGGTANFSVASNGFQWTGGVITGTAGSQAVFNTFTVLSGSGTKIVDTRGVALSSGTWTGGDIALNNGSLGFGTLIIQSDNTMSASGTGSLSISAATKNTATGTTTIAAPLVLTGSLTADSGRIVLTGGGTASGLFQTHSGGAIEFGGGTYNLSHFAALGSFGDNTGGDFLVTGGRVNITTNGITINQGSTLTLATGGTLGGAVSYFIGGNSFQWTGGVITGTAASTLTVQTSAVLSGPATKTVDTRNVSLNTGTWTGGDIAANNATLTLGTFAIQSDNALTASGTGTVNIFAATKDTTTGTTTISAPVVVTGSLTADSGRILLTGGGTASGVFQTHDGGAIEFGGGTYTISNSSGFGSFGGATGGGFFITGGLVNVRTAGSTINQGSDLTLATGGTLGGTTSNYTLGGNSFQWTGGVITGSASSLVFINTPTVLSGTATKTVNNRSLSISSGTWAGGDIAASNAALSFGDLAIQSDNTVTTTGTYALALNNAVKNTATGTTTIAAPLSLTGTLTADSGRILLTGGGTASGVFQTHTGGAIEFGGGTYNLSGFNAFGSFDGNVGGDILITGGRVNVNTFSSNVGQGADLTLATGGTLAGTGNYNVTSNRFQWTGGVITGGTNGNIIVSAPTVLSGPALKTLDTRTLSLGQSTWTGGDIALTNNARLNVSNLTIQSDATLTGSGSSTFATTGTLVKNTTTGTTTIAAAYTNLGLVAVDSGVLRLASTATNSGAIAVHSGGTLNVAAYLDGNGSLDVADGGTLMGSGTIHGATTISGALAPGNSPGNLTFESNVTVADGGTYFMDLGALKDDSTGTAGVDWDLLTLTGNASLTFQPGSKLSLVFNGLTTPDPENPFWQQAHTWLIGSLDTGLLTTDGLRLTDNETSAGYFGYYASGNDLYLAFAVIPEPSTIALLAASLGALALAARRRVRK